MKTTIDYLQNDPAFHHPDCRCLFTAHDTIGNLADCPFPGVHPWTITGTIRRAP